MFSRFALVALATLLFLATPAAQADTDEQVLERLEKLERLVIRDPLRPKEPVIERLSALEKRLDNDARAAVQAGRETQKQDTQLARTLEGLQKQMTDLDRRLDTLERQKPAATPRPDNANELRNLKQTTDTLARDLKALQDRLSRLERAR